MAEVNEQSPESGQYLFTAIYSKVAVRVGLVEQSTSIVIFTRKSYYDVFGTTFLTTMYRVDSVSATNAKGLR